MTNENTEELEENSRKSKEKSPLKTDSQALIKEPSGKEVGNKWSVFQSSVKKITSIIQPQPQTVDM